MRGLVVGCGAIGGIYAARLTRVMEMVAFDTNARHIAAINRDGLRLTGRSELTAALKATAVARDLAAQAFDVVLVTVKSQATAAAFDAVREHLRGDPLLVTLQNGMGNVETLAERSRFDIAQGASTEAGRVLGPGRIEHLVHGEDSWLGPVRGTLARVDAFGALLNGSGMPTRVVNDPRGAVWSKFIFNCVMNPIGALVLGENRARYEIAQMRELIDAMFAEASEVARVQGIELPFDPMMLVKKTRSGELPLTRHAGSMAGDLAAGRETELEALTGYLVRKAHALGVSVPVSETVYRLAKGLEYATLIRRGAVA